MIFQLRLSKSARRELLRLPQSDRQRVVERFGQLCVDPFTIRFSDWLDGTENMRRSRVGPWRILFEVDLARRVVEIDAVRPRGEAYRRL